MHLLKLRRSSTALIALCLTGFLSRPEAATPQAFGQTADYANVVVGPADISQLDQLLSQPAQWTTLRRSVKVILFADHSLTKIDDATLSRWFAAMASLGLHLELEVGAVKPWSAKGANTFKIERVIWDRLTRLGAPISSIAMDEPLIATRSVLHKPDSYATDETAAFVALVRKAYPAMQIGDIEPYPAVSSRDEVQWISNLNLRLKELGTRGLDFFRVDPDWAAFGKSGSWLGLKFISDQCRSRGLMFSLIYWAAQAPSARAQGMSTERTWVDGLLREAKGFQSVGGTADQVVIESWLELPRHAGPESNPSSLSGSALSLIKALR